MSEAGLVRKTKQRLDSTRGKGFRAEDFDVDIETRRPSVLRESPTPNAAN
jgi:hypothetical protein